MHMCVFPLPFLLSFHMQVCNVLAFVICICRYLATYQGTNETFANLCLVCIDWCAGDKEKGTLCKCKVIFIWLGGKGYRLSVACRNSCGFQINLEPPKYFYPQAFVDKTCYRCRLCKYRLTQNYLKIGLLKDQWEKSCKTLHTLPEPSPSVDGGK